MVEYALLVALIAVVAVVSTRRLGVRVSDKFGEASLQLEGAGDWED
jgi:Flp pilus assembly pilin Flp